MARIHSLGNQYELLQQWDTAKEYYEQSNVNGKSDASIACCLLKLGHPQEAVTMLSDVLTESIFNQYRTVDTLADGWNALGEKEKACDALEWMYSMMESLHYNPTTMLLLQVKLAAQYEDCGRTEAAESAMRKAAELVKEDISRKTVAEADFLRIKKAGKLLISAPDNNREMLINLAAAMGESFASIVNEVLQ